MCNSFRLLASVAFHLLHQIIQNFDGTPSQHRQQFECRKNAKCQTDDRAQSEQCQQVQVVEHNGAEVPGLAEQFRQFSVRQFQVADAFRQSLLRRKRLVQHQPLDTFCA